MTTVSNQIPKEFHYWLTNLPFVHTRCVPSFTCSSTTLVLVFGFVQYNKCFWPFILHLQSEALLKPDLMIDAVIPSVGAWGWACCLLSSSSRAGQMWLFWGIRGVPSNCKIPSWDDFNYCHSSSNHSIVYRRVVYFCLLRSVMKKNRLFLVQSPPVKQSELKCGAERT